MIPETKKPPAVNRIVMHGQVYLNADDMRRALQDPDLLYTLGVVMKVHMESGTPQLIPGWRGAIQVVAGGFLRFSLGLEDVLVEPAGQK